MMKSKFKFLITTLLCVLSMSCSMLVDDNATGAISLELPVPSVSRAPIDEITYTVILEGPEDIQVEEVVINDKNRNTTVSFDKLKKGNYGLFVDGFDSRYSYHPNDLNPGKSYSVDVIPGKTTTVPIVLEATVLNGSLLARNGKDGVDLTLPKVHDATYCEIECNNIMTGETTIIYVDDFNNNTTVTNPFVSKDELYYFDASYYSVDLSHKEKLIKNVQSNPLLTLTGRGELDLSEKPKASFDYDNHIMTLETPFKIRNNLGQLKYSSLLEYEYQVGNEVKNADSILFENKKGNQIKFDKASIGEEAYNNDLINPAITVGIQMVYETQENCSVVIAKTFTDEYMSNMPQSIYSQVVTLTVLDHADRTAPNFQYDTREIWQAFEETHPNIRIEREVLFNEHFHKKTEAYVASGKMPDVFFMWPGGRSANIHNKKMAKDLKPLLERDGILNDYKENCVNPSLQYGGYLAEIPFGLSTTSCMYVNTKVLKECGIQAPAKTYEELKEHVRILKEHNKQGIIMANQDDWVMQSCLFSLVLGRFAGPNWADDISSGKTNFKNSEPFKQAVTFIKQMYDDGVLSQQSLATPYGDVPGQFANEQGGYYIDGDWRAGAFMTDSSTGMALISPDKQESDIELIQFPSIPNEVYPESNSGTLGVGYGMSSAIPAGSAKEKAAWELIKWLSGPVMQQRRLNSGESYPSLKDENIDFTNLEPIVKKRSSFYGLTKTLTPVFDGYMDMSVSNVLQTELQKLGLGQSTVDQVITAVDEAYKASKQ